MLYYTHAPHRRYDYTSLRDLMRVVRNKRNHFREMPQQLQVGAEEGGRDGGSEGGLCIPAQTQYSQTGIRDVWHVGGSCGHVWLCAVISALHKSRVWLRCLCAARVRHCATACTAACRVPYTHTAISRDPGTRLPHALKPQS